MPFLSFKHKLQATNQQWCTIFNDAAYSLLTHFIQDKVPTTSYERDIWWEQIVTSNITKKTLSTVKSRLRWKYFLSISSEGEARRLNSKSSKHQYQYWSLKNKSAKNYDLRSFRHTAPTTAWQFGFQLQYVHCVILELDARSYFSGMIKKCEHWALFIIFIIMKMMISALFPPYHHHHYLTTPTIIAIIITRTWEHGWV